MERAVELAVIAAPESTTQVELIGVIDSREPVLEKVPKIVPVWAGHTVVEREPRLAMCAV